MNLRSRLLLGILGASVPAFSAAAQQVWLTYDPTGDQLPETQCWALQQSGGPAPLVTEGVLTLGPSSSGAYLYYTREAAISFTRGAVMEAEVFIVDSAYSSNPCGAGPRAGTYLSMFDDAGRLMYLGIANDTLYITCDASRPPGPGSPTATVHCQGVWRTYRVEVSDGAMRVYVDGVLTLTAAVDGPLYGSRREAGFGDESSCAAGHSRYRSVRVLAVEDCRVDFNRDGFVDFFDYDDYVRCFETGACPCDQTADYNGDGFADFFDYDDYVAGFEAGC